MEAWRCVEDGICSPEDCDTAVSQGLGLRWSFMGPFETIDLNAPEGTKDYCERYGENITVICAEQDKLGARAMKGSATADVIHAAMRKAIPADKLVERRKWRDDRLASLYLHKRDMLKKEQGSK
jgi:L-gulonate 3-dehydrogenase